MNRTSQRGQQIFKEIAFTGLLMVTSMFCRGVSRLSDEARPVCFNCIYLKPYHTCIKLKLIELPIKLYQ